MNFSKNKKRRINTILSVVLALVVVFNLFSSSFSELRQHKHFHEDVCSAEFEKDPCHRFLIHHEESFSCNKEHKHLTNKTEDCFVCKYHKERQNDLSANCEQLLYVIYESSTHYSSSASNINSLSVFYTYLRGPPSCMC